MKVLLTITGVFFYLLAYSQPGAHSHNDYEHTRPLYDALDCNFNSIEADVYCVGDSLFVAHDFDKIKSGRTLRNLYLEPLKNQIAKNGGSVYGNGEEIILFIDIKNNGLLTYQLLHKILKNYKAELSVFENGIKRKGSILVVVSGERPIKFMESQTIRFAAYDGRINNLDTNIPSTLMPVVSDNWSNHFKWNGTGEFPANEKDKLQLLASKARSQGYILRFWGTPNQTDNQKLAIWNALSAAGVGMIGTDDLNGLRQFLSSYSNK